MSPATLQALPTELRLEIFRNVIPFTQAHYPFRRSIQETKQRHADKAQNPPWPALMGVSRKIRAEAIEVFFNSENAFCFFELDTFDQWAKTLDNDSKQSVRRVAISIPPSLQSKPQEALVNANDPNHKVVNEKFEKQLLSSIRSNFRAAINSLTTFPNLSMPKLTLHHRIEHEQPLNHDSCAAMEELFYSLLYDFPAHTPTCSNGIQVVMLDTTTPSLMSPNTLVNTNSNPEPVTQSWRCYKIKSSCLGPSGISHHNCLEGSTTTGASTPLTLPKIHLRLRSSAFIILPSEARRALRADKLRCARCSRRPPLLRDLSGQRGTALYECPCCRRGPYCSEACLRADEQAGHGCGQVTEARRVPPRDRWRLQRPYQQESGVASGAKNSHHEEDAVYDEWALLCLGEAVTIYGPSPKGELAKAAQWMENGNEVRAPRPEKIPFSDPSMFLTSEGVRMLRRS
ncbi:MAG: hypothetical protein Q9160_008811 [Pyrenula sp. 1 TL-2023]